MPSCQLLHLAFRSRSIEKCLLRVKFAKLGYSNLHGASKGQKSYILLRLIHIYSLRASLPTDNAPHLAYQLCSVTSTDLKCQHSTQSPELYGWGTLSQVHIEQWATGKLSIPWAKSATHIIQQVPNIGCWVSIRTHNTTHVYSPHGEKQQLVLSVRRIWLTFPSKASTRITLPSSRRAMMNFPSGLKRKSEWQHRQPLQPC